MPPEDMRDLVAALSVALERCAERGVEVSDLRELVTLASAVRGGEKWKAVPLANAVAGALRSCESGGFRVGDDVSASDVHRIESPRVAAAFATVMLSLVAHITGTDEEAALAVAYAACSVAIERAPGVGAEKSPDRAGAMLILGRAVAQARHSGNPPTTPITALGIALRALAGKLWGEPARASVESIWQVHRPSNVGQPLAIVRRLETSNHMPIVACEGYGVGPADVPLLLPRGAWRDPNASGTEGHEVEFWRVGPRPGADTGAKSAR